jgi:hypothetical protein
MNDLPKSVMFEFCTRTRTSTLFLGCHALLTYIVYTARNRLVNGPRIHYFIQFKITFNREIILRQSFYGTINRGNFIKDL